MSEPSPVSDEKSTRRPRRRGLVTLALVVVALLVAVVPLRRAWRATQLREAYIADMVAAAKSSQDPELLAVLGARLAEARHFDEAAWVLQAAIHSGRNDPLCWKAAAATEAAAGRPDRARETLQRGISQGVPGLREASDKVARVAASAAPDEVAAAILPEGTGGLAEQMARGSFLNGVASWWGRSHPETSGFATRQEWAHQEPNNGEAQRLWGEALLRNKVPALALPVLQRAVLLAPDSAPAHRDRADLAAQLGDLDGAAQEYETSLKLHSGWEPALLGLGQVRLQQDKVGPAADSFEQVMRNDPNSVEACVGFGRACLRWSERVSEGITAFARAVTLAPARTDFYCDYAEALRVRYDFDTAEKILRRRIQAAPDDGRAHYMLGYVLAQSGGDAKRAAEAERELRTALKYSPGQVAAEVELGRFLTQQQRPKEAIPVLRAALAQDSLSQNAARLLAAALQQDGQTAAAREADARADMIGKTLARLQALTHRAQGEQNNADLYRQLGKIYLSVGQTERARAELAHAVAIEHMRVQGASKAPVPVAGTGVVAAPVH